MAKSSEICQLAINIVAWNYGEVQYRLGNTLYYADDLKWCNLTWGGPPGYYSDAWHADCLGFVRACLCEWHADKNAYGGGANINPNDPNAYNCKDFNEAMFIGSCSSRSSDFTQLNIPCSLLYKSGHVGLYVGEFQLNGKTYNSCECCYGLQYGGYPTWTDPDGQRKRWKGDNGSGSYWEEWGLFNLNGTDYGITEYDGGAIGATGFGTALSQTEVEFYWNTLPELTFDYVQEIADNIHGMSADVFTVMAGWGWGEGYSVIPPVGDSDPDVYMAYLCDCCPVNYFEGWGITTGQQMAAAIAGGDTSGHYDYSAMIARGLDLKANETSSAGQNELRALLLALLNPNQDAWFCSGYPQSGDVIIYQRQYAGQGMIYSFYDPDSKVPYDVTGSGIRGGDIPPSGRKGKGIPIWMYLRPYTHTDQYRLGSYYHRR